MLARGKEYAEDVVSSAFVASAVYREIGLPVPAAFEKRLFSTLSDKRIRKSPTSQVISLRGFIFSLFLFLYSKVAPGPPSSAFPLLGSGENRLNFFVSEE